jgi:hypothetical protein
LDPLVHLINNWLDDPNVGFEVKGGPQDVDGFGEAKGEILDVIGVEFFNEVEDYVKDYVQNWHMCP